MPTSAPYEIVDGKYELFREIGSGSQGIVYEAGSLHTQQLVALKRLRPEYSQHKSVVRRFILEANTIARFSHPNIIRVLDVGQDPRDGLLYMVQPLLAGTDLAAVLDGYGRLRPREALDLLVPIMAALIATHRAGVIHRDLKPENIFLMRDPERGVRPILLDFGIAKLLDDNTLHLTATGGLIGTPEYMSPEQCVGDSSIDGRADVWSMGVILFELIAGARPFTGGAIPELLARIVSQRAPRLDATVPDVSPELASIVAHALEPSRDKRFPTMSAFLEALLECPTLDKDTTGRDLAQRHHESLSARVPMGVEDNAPVAPIVEHETLTLVRDPRADSRWISDTLVDRVAPSGMVTIPKSARRNWLAPVALIALGVLVGALVTVFALHRAPESFTVSLSVEPPTASVELDGTLVGVGSVVRDLPRDGRAHVLRLRAPGYVARSLTFRDAPPPSPQRLSAEPAAR